MLFDLSHGVDAGWKAGDLDFPTLRQGPIKILARMCQEIGGRRPGLAGWATRITAAASAAATTSAAPGTAGSCTAGSCTARSGAPGAGTPSARTTISVRTRARTAVTVCAGASSAGATGSSATGSSGPRSGGPGPRAGSRVVSGLGSPLDPERSRHGLSGVYLHASDSRRHRPRMLTDSDPHESARLPDKTRARANSTGDRELVARSTIHGRPAEANAVLGRGETIRRGNDMRGADDRLSHRELACRSPRRELAG